MGQDQKPSEKFEQLECPHDLENTEEAPVYIETWHAITLGSENQAKGPASTQLSGLEQNRI